MMVLLAEHSDEPVDVGHTVQLVLIHDLIEIYAGDTPLYDRAAGRGPAGAGDTGHRFVGSDPQWCG